MQRFSLSFVLIALCIALCVHADETYGSVSMELANSALEEAKKAVQSAQEKAHLALEKARKVHAEAKRSNAEKDRATSASLEATALAGETSLTEKAVEKAESASNIAKQKFTEGISEANQASQMALAAEKALRNAQKLLEEVENFGVPSDGNYNVIKSKADAALGEAQRAEKEAEDAETFVTKAQNSINDLKKAADDAETAKYEDTGIIFVERAKKAREASKPHYVDMEKKQSAVNNVVQSMEEALKDLIGDTKVEMNRLVESSKVEQNEINGVVLKVKEAQMDAEQSEKMARDALSEIQKDGTTTAVAQKKAEEIKEYAKSVETVLKRTKDALSTVQKLSENVEKANYESIAMIAVQKTTDALNEVARDKTRISLANQKATDAVNEINRIALGVSEEALNSVKVNIKAVKDALEHITRSITEVNRIFQTTEGKRNAITVSRNAIRTAMEIATAEREAQSVQTTLKNVRDMIANSTAIVSNSMTVANNSQQLKHTVVVILASERATNAEVKVNKYNEEALRIQSELKDLVDDITKMEKGTSQKIKGVVAAKLDIATHAYQRSIKSMKRIEEAVKGIFKHKQIIISAQSAPTNFDGNQKATQEAFSAAMGAELEKTDAEKALNAVENERATVFAAKEDVKRVLQDFNKSIKTVIPAQQEKGNNETSKQKDNTSMNTGANRTEEHTPNTEETVNPADTNEVEGYATTNSFNSNIIDSSKVAVENEALYNNGSFYYSLQVYLCTGLVMMIAALCVIE